MPFAARRRAGLGHPGAGRRRHLSRRRSAWRRCSACWSRWPSPCCRSAGRATCRRRRCFARWASKAAACRAWPMSLRRSASRSRLPLLADLVLRRPAHRRRSSSAPRSSPSSCCAASASARAVAGPQEPARALDGAPAGDRQHPPARRADAVGRAVARARADAARHAGADRRQSAAADRRQPAGARAELLLRRHPEQPRSTPSPALIASEAPDGKLMRGADAARPHHGAERRRRAEGRACRRKAPGCCAATAASPMPTALPENATLARRRMVAGGLCRRAAGLLLGGGGRRDRAEARRHRHRQRARPQHHRPDRQFPQGRVGIDGHQLRHGVLAQHLCRRAAFLAGDADDRRTPRPPTRRGCSTP